MAFTKRVHSSWDGWGEMEFIFEPLEEARGRLEMYRSKDTR